jgi:ribonuclease P protein component
VRRRHRLTSRADFERVSTAGRRISCPQLVLTYATGMAGTPRIGFSIGRRLGAAVVRNRLRRRLREAIRPLLDDLPAADLVIAPRSSALSATSAELRETLRGMLTDAGLLGDQRSLHNGGTTPD